MGYIKKYFNEIDSLVEHHAFALRDACRTVRDKYSLNKNVDAMSMAFKREREKQNLHITKIVKNGDGKVITQTESLKGFSPPANMEDFELVGFTSNAYTDSIWGRYVNVKHLIGLNPEELQAELDKRIPKNIVPTRAKGCRGDGVFLISDFHLGASVTELIATPDFGFSHVARMLQEIADIINSLKYKRVHIFLIGDFIESFTGLNHINSWKGLSKGAYGMKGVIFAHEILVDNLYSKVNNLNYVGFVAGNHDRVTSNKQEDQEGEVALMMRYLFDKDFGGKVKSEWSPLLISKEIDNINYICMHGHLSLSDKEITKIILRYGIQGKYNVVAKGHKHTRVTKKYYSQAIIKFEDINYVHNDELEYRGLTVAPLFTGNFYSEALGYSSTAGFTHICNNGRDKIIHTDYTL